MGLLSGLFGSKKAPTMPTLDLQSVMNQELGFANQSIDAFGKYLPQMTQMMQSAYNQISPNVSDNLDALNQFATGLMNTGQTSAMGDYAKLLQQQSLEAASASGMPIGSQFTASLGSGLGSQQILQNQLSGANLLNTATSQQEQLAQYFMSPALQMLQTTTPSYGQTLQANQYNNQIEQQNAMIKAQNSSSGGLFGNLLQLGVGGLVSGFTGGLGGIGTSILGNVLGGGSGSSGGSGGLLGSWLGGGSNSGSWGPTGYTYGGNTYNF